MLNSFDTFELITKTLVKSCDALFPTALHAWSEETLALSGASDTHFGFVQRGTAVLQTAAGDEFRLGEKMYFCVPGQCSVTGGGGIIVTRFGYRGLFLIGGRIEENGRLRYIDGCTDTLLIAPPVFGDPCLNALYFPRNIRQTPHTHPSVRVGIIASGAGECVLSDRTIALAAGQAFIIAPHARHSFNTASDEMIVIAYHPDSDFGATDKNHPMVNRTMVEGVSAAALAEIRTV